MATMATPTMIASSADQNAVHDRRRNLQLIESRKRADNPDGDEGACGDAALVTLRGKRIRDQVTNELSHGGSDHHDDDADDQLGYERDEIVKQIGHRVPTKDAEGGLKGDEKEHGLHETTEERSRLELDLVEFVAEAHRTNAAIDPGLVCHTRHGLADGA